MSLGILTNVAATYAENNLNQTQGSLQTVLQQLSSPQVRASTAARMTQPVCRLPTVFMQTKLR